MTNEELFDFVHADTVGNPDSILGKFEPWHLSDISSVAERYSIPVYNIIQELVDAHIKPDHDLIVLDGESIYSCSLEDWANEVREFFQQKDVIPSVSEDESLALFMQDKALFDYENKELFIPIFDNGNIEGIEIAHFFVSIDEILASIDNGHVADDSLVCMAWDYIPDPYSGQTSDLGRRELHKFQSSDSVTPESAKLVLKDFIHNQFVVKNRLPYLVPEHAILDALRFQSFKKKVLSDHYSVSKRKVSNQCVSCR